MLNTMRLKLAAAGTAIGSLLAVASAHAASQFATIDTTLSTLADDTQTSVVSLIGKYVPIAVLLLVVGIGLGYLWKAVHGKKPVSA